MNREKYQSPDHEMYDRTDRYVLGIMEEDERVAFEKDMATDASLSDSVSVRRTVIEEVRRKEALRDTFLAVEAAYPYKAVDSLLDRNHVHSRKPQTVSMRRIIYSVATVLAAACLISGIFFRYSYVSQGSNAGYGIVLGDVVQPMRGESSIDDILKAVDEERYEAAEELIAAFRSVPAPEYDLSTEEGSYLYEQYRADCMAVDYIEAVTLLRQGHPFKAKRILKSLVAADTYYSAYAAELLEKL